MPNRFVLDWLLRRDRREAIPTHELVHLTMLALVMIGLNVGTVLMASVFSRWHELAKEGKSVELGESVIEWLTAYGWMALAVPVIWIGATIAQRSRIDRNEVTSIFAVFVGWAIIGLWLYLLVFQVLKSMIFACNLSLAN